MAFPTTSVLDDFNRANGALGANYSEEPFNDTIEASFAIATNVVSLTADAYGSVWYNAASYGPNAEVYIDIPVAAAAGAYNLYLRIAQPSAAASTGDGYKVEQINGAGLTFYRVDNGVSTALGATDVTADLASGDKFGAAIIGQTLYAYRYTSGAWAGYGTSRTDTTYTAAGFIGFGLYDLGGTSRYDNFGGGTAVSDNPDRLAAESLFTRRRRRIV